MMMQTRVRLALAALLLSGSALAAEPLGRLFFTPDRRAALDRTRSLNQRQTQQVEATDLSLEGIVRRSSGRNTVWLNGRPYDSTRNGDDVAIAVGADPATARIRIGGEPPSDLRVGETMNRGTRERSSAIGSGQISTRRGDAR